MFIFVIELDPADVASVHGRMETHKPSQDDWNVGNAELFYFYIDSFFYSILLVSAPLRLSEAEFFFLFFFFLIFWFSQILFFHPLNLHTVPIFSFSWDNAYTRTRTHTHTYKQNRTRKKR